MEAISVVDAKVLEFLRNKNTVEIASVSAHMGFDCTQRLMNLENLRYVSTPKKAVPISLGDMTAMTLQSTGICQITELGRIALQDYQAKQESEMKLLWLRSVWLPILVSIATTLLVHLLSWLLPRIPIWFASSP